MLLQGALERARTEVGVVANFGQPLARLGCEFHLQAKVLQAAFDVRHLQVNDLRHLLQAERREGDDLVNAVDEFGAEGLFKLGLDFALRLALFAVASVTQKTQAAGATDIFGAQVAGHNQHRVAEINDMPLSIGQAAIVEDLQQRVPHLGMGFFDLVEEDHPVGAAAHSLGELTAFFVTHVPWGRAEQPRDGVLLVVLAHVNAHQGILIVKHEFGQRLGKLGFAHAGRPDEDERADGAFGVFEAGAGAADGIGDGADGGILPDDALVQPLFHVQQALRLGLQHLVDRDAGPLGDHFGHVVGVHDLVQLVFALPLLAGGVEFLLQAGALHLLFSGALVVALQAGLFLLGHQALDFGLHRLEVGGQGVQRHAQLGGGLVNQVNRFVGQPPIGDVAVGKLRRGHQRLIGDADFVVRLVAVAQSLQHADGVLHVWLFHVDRRKTTLQGGVLLNVFMVLIQRGGADALQLAAR